MKNFLENCCFYMFLEVRQMIWAAFKGYEGEHFWKNSITSWYSQRLVEEQPKNPNHYRKARWTSTIWNGPFQDESFCDESFL